MEIKNHIGLDEEAARWHARMMAEDCSQSDREALSNWRKHNRHHEAAYQRVCRVVDALDSLHSDARMQSLADQAFEASRGVRHSRCDKRLWPAAIAASLVLASLTFLQSGGIDQQASPIVYETSRERTSITLDDGSTAVLDVDTRIAVRITTEAREVQLVAGRALFEVAHDNQRPFSVDANGSRTTALGTRFQVQRTAHGVSVVLEQGSVSVEHLERGRAPVWTERLHAGEEVVIDFPSGLRSKRSVDPQIATSWTHNRHVFRATRLEDAIEEINRYASRKVRLGDPELADWLVAGSFIAGDSDQIMNAVASVLPLRLVDAGEHELVLFRRHSGIEQACP